LKNRGRPAAGKRRARRQRLGRRPPPKPHSSRGTAPASMSCAVAPISLVYASPKTRRQM
jgi:hypothetical protein